MRYYDRQIGKNMGSNAFATHTSNGSITIQQQVPTLDPGWHIPFTAERTKKAIEKDKGIGIHDLHTLAPRSWERMIFRANTEQLPMTPPVCYLAPWHHASRSALSLPTPWCLASLPPCLHTQIRLPPPSPP